MRKFQGLFKKLKLDNTNTLVATHLNLPRITMIGNIHVYIENHRGILRFTPEEIILKVTNGQLLIKGSELVIKMLLTAEILVEGSIRTLEIDQSSPKDGVGK